MSNYMDSLGFLETEGMVAAIEASDAMVKAANVQLRAARAFGGGRICLMVRGDLASCQAAIDAGRAAAEHFGGFLQCNVLARPDPNSEALWTEHMPAMEQRKKERARQKQAALAEAAAEQAVAMKMDSESAPAKTIAKPKPRITKKKA